MISQKLLLAIDFSVRPVLGPNPQEINYKTKSLQYIFQTSLFSHTGSLFVSPSSKKTS